MMYVEFMKNFALADSNKQMTFRLISASWARKRVAPSFYTCSATSSWKIFFWPIRASWRLLDSFRSPEPKNVWLQVFKHVLRRVHEKFSSRRFDWADGCYLISATCAQKRLIPSFLQIFCVEFMKNFLQAHSSELMAVRLISASWAQKRLTPSFYTCSTTSSWKIFFSPIRASWGLIDWFRSPEPKNVWFPLSRHDLRRVHKKYSSRRFEGAIGC